MSASNEKTLTPGEIPELPKPLKDLKNFDDLPNSAFVDIRVVAGLLGCSVGNAWLDLKKELIPAPVNLGKRKTRWNVGDLRAYLEAARKAPRNTWRIPTKGAAR